MTGEFSCSLPNACTELNLSLLALSVVSLVEQHRTVPCSSKNIIFEHKQFLKLTEHLTVEIRDVHMIIEGQGLKVREGQHVHAPKFF